MTKFWLYAGLVKYYFDIPVRLIAAYPRTAFVLWMGSLILMVRV